MTQADALMALVERLLTTGPPELTLLGAAMLAAHHMNVASDSRSFARAFDVAHALVLRECTTLADELALITQTRRDTRSQRQFYTLSPAGNRLLLGVLG